jgi:hypothetical protein
MHSNTHTLLCHQHSVTSLRHPPDGATHTSTKQPLQRNLSQRHRHNRSIVEVASYKGESRHRPIRQRIPEMEFTAPHQGQSWIHHLPSP